MLSKVVCSWCFLMPGTLGSQVDSLLLPWMRRGAFRRLLPLFGLFLPRLQAFRCHSYLYRSNAPPLILSSTRRSRSCVSRMASPPPLPRMEGELFCFYQDEYSKRVAFRTGSKSHKRHVVLIGGLSDGLLPVPYTTHLAEALDAQGWALVQVLLSSSYTGFGHCSLRTDCRELEALVGFLEREEGSQAVGMVGHSTGCQDAVFFMREASSHSKAPVSDREHLQMLPGTDQYIGVATAFKAEGNGEEMMPRSSFWAPITASRYLDLATREGLDDMFSSDLTPTELAERLGHVAVPTLLAFSAADEYVPATVDVPALGERIRAAMPGASPCRAVHLEGARHSCKGHEQAFVQTLLDFMQEAGLLLPSSSAAQAESQTETR